MYALDHDTNDVSYDVVKDTTLVKNSEEVIIIINLGATYLVISPSFVYKLVKDVNAYIRGHNTDS